MKKKIKKMGVDVNKSLELNQSLGYQENGRVIPADKKEYAKSLIKVFICPKCNCTLEVDKTSFGETILCPDCKEPMLQQQ